ncbi:hypothetical protein DL98DRAFT_442813, partial [Cadophora sp. DSE1049]
TVYLDNYFTSIPLFQELRACGYSTVKTTPLNNIHIIHQTDDFQAKIRRRPRKTSTNSRIVRLVFKEKHTKKLHIPRFINNYNYYIKRVDLANQFREVYETHRIT